MVPVVVVDRDGKISLEEFHSLYIKSVRKDRSKKITKRRRKNAQQIRG